MKYVIMKILLLLIIAILLHVLLQGIFGVPLFPALLIVGAILFVIIMTHPENERTK